MFRIIIVAVFGVMVAGCEKPPAEWTTSLYDLTSVDGFEDCTMAKIGTGEKNIYAMRCPSSTTSLLYTAGKTHAQAIVDDRASVETPSTVEAVKKEILQCEESSSAPGALVCVKQPVVE